MTPKVLTDAQIEQFITDGFVKLEEAFPPERALAAQDFLWERMAEQGVRKEDPSTWTAPLVHLKELYNEPVFQACATERLADAVEDLVGRGRWATRDQAHNWGWWPVNFAVGADRPWDVPTQGWHWDNMSRQSLTSPEQGLLLLPHFSAVGPRGGGTLVAAGSHRIVARLLAEYPDGVAKPEALARCGREHPWLAELTGAVPSGADRIAKFMETTTTDEWGTPLRVIETTAGPGDVILGHPFLYHAASQNHSGVPRFMCNRATPLREPMDLNRAEGDDSPLEISIRQALGGAD